MKKYVGEEFLNKIFKDLINSKEVKHTSLNKNKNEDVNIYMNRLEKITKKSKQHDNLRLIKEAYHNKYVIKKENIPPTYFTKREQIAQELGYGYIYYTEKIKEQEKQYIINEQKRSLDEWIEYFASEETKIYPTWFKYFCFQGIIKIGYLDKKRKKFTKRTETTTKPFAEINKEAISMIYKELIKILNKEEINDKELEILLKNGSFSKLYAYCTIKINKIKKAINNTEEGIWKKYPQGSDPQILFRDIHNKGTCWCTAGGIETSEQQLNTGDLYIYFTKDEFGKNTNPRIAIRTEFGEIVEIRGIEENQNIETSMEKIIEKKLEQFPDKEKYKKKINDMKKLTEIYLKQQKELTKEDLIFLYKIKSPILGFGYEEDERIRKILKKRDNIKDLNDIFKEIKTIENDLELQFLSDIKGLKLPEVIKGNLILTGIDYIEEIKIETLIYGNLDLSRLKKAKKIIIKNQIKRTIDLKSLEQIEELDLSSNTFKILDLRKLEKIKTLTLPKISGTIYLDKIKNISNIKLPEEIIGDLDLESLENIENIKLPKTINGYLSLDNVKKISNIKLPEKIGKSLYLKNLKEAKKIIFPKEVKGNIYLENLEIMQEIVFPEKIDGFIDLTNIKEIENIIIPDKLECTIKCPLVQNDINKLKKQIVKKTQFDKIKKK